MKKSCGKCHILASWYSYLNHSLFQNHRFALRQSMLNILFTYVYHFSCSRRSPLGRSCRNTLRIMLRRVNIHNFMAEIRKIVLKSEFSPLCQSNPSACVPGDSPLDIHVHFPRFYIVVYCYLSLRSPPLLFNLRLSSGYHEFHLRMREQGFVIR